MENPQEPVLPQPLPDPARQRNARKALEDFLKKLRNACAKISTMDDWTTLVSELNGVLEIYQIEIPAANRQRLESAMQIGEASKEALPHACSVLDLEITNTIKSLPKRGWSCGCLAAGLLGGLVVLIIGLIVAAVLLFQPVPVVVVNEGCNPMVVREAVPTAFNPALSFFQVQLPDILDTNEAEAFEVMGLPLNVDIDARARQSVDIQVIGIRQSFPVSSDVTEVIINGFPVLGTGFSVNVRGDAPHEVIIICQ